MHLATEQYQNGHILFQHIGFPSKQNKHVLFIWVGGIGIKNEEGYPQQHMGTNNIQTLNHLYLAQYLATKHC